MMTSALGSKSSQSQSTLFQTWGYSGNTYIEPRAQKSKKVKKSLRKASTKRKEKEENQDEENQNGENQNEENEFDDILECLENDDDIGLCEAIAQGGKNTYLDENFNTICSPESLPGFDTSSGHNYIYPINYPIRDYQFKIIMKALTQNTLVVLPTGLGKTFIAAVVMYNFYRWYPQGKILFMAPTKPLVAQQIQACYNITGIPQEDTAEMTGAMAPAKRKILWEAKRVFFLTPHILQNDLGRGTCFAKDIVCLVFDEAHKALGNYAYCQVIKEVAGCKANFRVLALSATPGGDMNAVQQVVTNLMVSHVELRNEESHDIKPYVFGRNVEKIVVPLSEELKKAKAQFIKVLEGITQRLCTQGACWQHDATKISKFFLLKARDQFRARGLEDRTRVGMIEGDFALAISMYHAFELLQQHGILSFYNFLKEVCCGTKGTARCRTELMRHEKFMEMMTDLQQRIEPDNMDSALNGSFLENLTPKRRLLKSIPKPNSLFSSHPKMKKLEEIVVKHFEAALDNLPDTSSQTPLNTRIMIFSQYRDSVQEITAVLSTHQPLVQVMSFVGQNGTAKGKKGLTQKEQLEVVERFRKGGYNVLVSTSVGEEGLDIGDVDLIICFDASNSPIRLVQRMGRTGRKRAGRIVILVTEGKEDQIYKRSLTNKKSIHKKLADAANSLVLYDENQRMIPKHLNPYCLKMQFTVKPKEPSSRSIKRKSTGNTDKKPRKKLNKSAATTDNDSKQNDDPEAVTDEEFCQRNPQGLTDENEFPEGEHGSNFEANCKKKVSTSTAKKKKTSKSGDKTSKKRTSKQQKIDKAKAWRRSTLKKDAKEASDDSNDDDILYVDDPVTEHPTDSDTTKDCAVSIRNRVLASLNTEDCFLAKESKSIKITTEINQMKNINILKKSEPVIKEFNKGTENAFLAGISSDEEDQHVFSQNLSVYLPNSTPMETFRRSKFRSSCRSFQGSKDVVPIPPSMADLNALSDNFMDDDASSGDGSNGDASNGDVSNGDASKDGVSNGDFSNGDACNVYEDGDMDDDIVDHDVMITVKDRNATARDAVEVDALSIVSFDGDIVGNVSPQGNFKDLDAKSEDFLDGVSCIDVDLLDDGIGDIETDGVVDCNKLVGDIPNGNVLNEFPEILDDPQLHDIDSCVNDTESNENFTSVRKKTKGKLPRANVTKPACFDAGKDHLYREIHGNQSSSLNRRTHQGDSKTERTTQNIINCIESDNDEPLENLDEFETDADFNCGKQDMEDIDLSTSCLFEDSLILDAEDCPSPPVVTQRKTSESNKIETNSMDRNAHSNLAGGSSDSGREARRSNITDSFDISNNDVEYSIETSKSKLDCMQVIPSKAQGAKCPVLQGQSNELRDSCYDYELSLEKSIKLNDLENNSLTQVQNFNMLSSESDDENHDQLPVLSLTTRLKNRGIFRAKSENMKETCTKQSYEEHDSNKISGSPIIISEFDSYKKNCEETASVKSIKCESFQESRDVASTRRLNSSFCLDSDNEASICSLATRLKNRGVKLSPRQPVCSADAQGKSSNSRLAKSEVPDLIESGKMPFAGDISCSATTMKFPAFERNIHCPGKLKTANIGSALLTPKTGSTLEKMTEIPRTAKHVTFSSNPELLSTQVQSTRGHCVEGNSYYPTEEESPLVIGNRRKRKRRRILEDSPLSGNEDLRNSSNDSDDEVPILKRKRKMKSRVLASPLACDAKGNSDDDFSHDSSFQKPSKSTYRTDKRNIQAMKTKSKKTQSDFIEHEAEVTDDDSGDDIDTDCNEYLMDSFIDDATQATQKTPLRSRKGHDESVDMAMVYRQSLISPMYGALNFGTPAFRANRNRYKMVGRNAWHKPSDDDDEAEEVNGFIEESIDFEDLEASEDSPLLTSDDARGDRSRQSDVSCELEPRKKTRIRRIVDSDDDEHDDNDVLDSPDKKSIVTKANNSGAVEDKKFHSHHGQAEVNNTDLIAHNHQSFVEVSKKRVTCNESPVHKSETILPKLQENVFIPCFDLGLDLGHVNSQMIENSWKNIGSRNHMQKKKSEVFVTSDSNCQTERHTVPSTAACKSKPCIFISTKTVTSSQIGSLLRLKHHVEITVCSQLGCDFVISKRMGVLRRLLSDMMHNRKNVAAIKELCDLYRKRCIIIEKDRVKGGSASERHASYTKYYTGLLGNLVECHIKILFSDSQEETALLVSQLASNENETAFRLTPSTNRLENSNLEQLLKVLLTVPHITYPIAIEICNHFKCLKNLVNSSVEEVRRLIPELSSQRAKDIVQYFHYKMNTQSVENCI